jgi:hypothetical protein
MVVFLCKILLFVAGSRPTILECHKIANLKGLNFPAHMISCLTELPLYRLIIYIDGRILWCTHFLLNLDLLIIDCNTSLEVSFEYGSFSVQNIAICSRKQANNTWLLTKENTFLGCVVAYPFLFVSLCCFRLNRLQH